MDWLANRAGKLVVSRRVICMSEREEEEEEEDSMEGFMHTRRFASHTLRCQILFPRLWIFFAVREGEEKYWTRDAGKFTVRLAFIVRFDRWRAVPDIHRIPSVSILLSFLCPPGYL